MRGARIRSLIFNRPLMIHPGKLAAIANAVADRIGLEPDAITIEAAVDDLNSQPRQRSFQITRGVAVIPVVGSLVHRTTGLDAMSGLMSYGSIGVRLREAVGDDEVKSILLEVDSFGGEVGGCFDLADRIFEARQSKPVWAIANDSAFSAAYALGCAAEKLFVSPTGSVGSIGVIASHMDQSVWDAIEGLKWTIIHAGEHKADLNPHQPLNDSGRERLQALVDQNYDVLVRAVARNRSLSEEAVRATEAQFYTPEEAVSLGLADGIGGFREVLRNLAGLEQSGSTVTAGSGLAAREDQPEEETMSDTQTPAPQAATPPDPAPADSGNAAVDERARIKAITTCEEAKGRADLAEYLAFETTTNPEAARAILAKAPAEAEQEPAAEAQPQGPGFTEAMANIDNPDLGPGGDDDSATEMDQYHLGRAMAERHGIKDYRPGRRQK